MEPTVKTPRVLILAPDPGARGGVQRVTRALIHALATEFGEERVGLVPVWATAVDDLPCRVLRRAPGRRGERARIGYLNKIGFVVVSLLSAWRWRRDLVIVNAHAWLAPVAWACGALTGAPFVQWAHGSEVWFGLGKIQRASLHRASVSFAPSAFTAARLEETARLQSGSVVVVPHPFEVPDQAEEPLGPSPVAGRYVMTVGRMDAGERRKGVDVTICALEHVLPRVPDLRYVVVGEGEDLPRLQDVADDASVAESVIFAGGLSDQDLASLYRDAEVFVMPSGQEGYGLAYLEAGKFGVPSIAGWYGGAPEAVLDGVTGFVVPYGDVDALAKRLLQLLEDETLRDSLGEEAQRVTTTRNSFSRFQSSMADIVGRARDVSV